MRRYSSMLGITTVLIAAILFTSLVTVNTALGLPFQATDAPTEMPTEFPTDAPTLESPTLESPTQPADSGSGDLAVFPVCTDGSPAGTSGAHAATTSEATVDMGAMSTPMATVDAGASSATGRGYLGVVVTGIADCGVRVVEVIADGPAFVGQLAVNDVIVAINGISLATLIQNDNMLATALPSASGDGAMSTPNTTAEATAEATVDATDANATPMADATSDSDNGTTVGSAGSFGGYASAATRSFFGFIQSMPPGTPVVLTVQRGGQQIDVMVTLGTLTSDGVTDSEGTVIGNNGDASATTESPVEPTLESTPEATANG